MENKRLTSQLTLITVLIIIGIGAGCEQNITTSKKAITSQMDSVSYIVGNNLAYQSVGVDLNADMIYQGYLDAKDSSGSVIDQADAIRLMTVFRKELEAEQARRLQQESITNEILGSKFLEKNRDEEGVIESPSGLQYIILEEGTGNSPSIKSIVSTRFTGELIDGTIFDTTEGAGPNSGPRRFEVAKVIEGWREALLQMKSGAKWKLFIPAKLGYGRELRDPIPPNSLLIFELELLEVID